MEVKMTRIAELAELLHETADHHGLYESTALPHDWWDWYAAYMNARQHGSTSEEASAAAGTTWRTSYMSFPGNSLRLAARAERVSEWVPRDAPPLASHAELAGGRHGHSAARLLLTHKPVEVPDGRSPAPADQMALCHFIVAADIERSVKFYTEVLGGKTVSSGEPTYVALANSWIIINVGGGPTDDKPTVTLETPPDPDRASSFLNIRVSDVHAVFEQWSARGAEFLTPPKQHDTEIRCYIRDPDGHLIELGQTTLARGWRPPS
jgi:catechol 2,3-dioxygenase-like lactoylglutathione lyase family enzyme